ALLSPGLALFLYGIDHVAESAGAAALAGGIALLAAFLWVAKRKGDRALIDLRLFGNRVFGAAALSQFLSNGVSFAGQMLIPLYLIRAAERSPAEAGWLMAPLGLGMILTYPSLGALTNRFGIRNVSAGGAFLAMTGTLTLAALASFDLDVYLLAFAL